MPLPEIKKHSLPTSLASHVEKFLVVLNLVSIHIPGILLGIGSRAKGSSNFFPLTNLPTPEHCYTGGPGNERGANEELSAEVVARTVHDL